MVIVKLCAGLGNQMFQYALGRRLSLDWKSELKFDLSWFVNIKKGETPRNLEIDKFNILLNKITEKDVYKLKQTLIIRVFRKIINRIYGRLDRNYFYRFHSNLLKKRKFAYLEGYFQSYKYFDSIRSILLSDFVLNKGYSVEALMLKNEIELIKQSVAIHVRRGDYVTTCKNWNGLCDINYYKKALSHISKKHADIKLYVFSDDIEWARSNLKFNYQTIFVSRPSLNSAEELMLMSLCEHQIIANSSFSWWAAWLNQNEEKIVVAPRRWLLAADIDSQDLIPESWIKI